MKKYSPSTNAFYDADINPSIPADAVEITDEQWLNLLTGQCDGLVIKPGKGGMPSLAERVITKAEKLAQLDAMKLELRAVADKAIAPLQDAVSLGMATDEESLMLKAWTTYRVLLNRIDVTTGDASDIDWPELPA